jgi:hypothetical protein
LFAKLATLSAIIGMPSAIDRNQCPQSIGTPVRNPRNPQPQPQTVYSVAEPRVKRGPRLSTPMSTERFFSELRSLRRSRRI